MPALGEMTDDDGPEDLGTPRPGLLVTPAGRPRRSVRPDDEELAGLAARARDGDRAALDRLLHVVQPHVVTYCRSRLGAGRIGLSGPDDIAQEVLIAVSRGLPRFESTKSPFLAFVFGIAANKVADAFRAAARDKSVSTEELPEALDETGGPEERAVRRETARRMSALLDQLPGSGRDVLTLRLGLRYSADETARLLDMTPGAVRVAQHRALGRLRTRIAADPNWR